MNHSIKKAKPKAVDWLIGGGEMGRLIRDMDWSQTALGPIESWPQSLRTTVSLCLASNFPISIAWGPQRTQIYNDGYWPICGAKHPHSMGQDFKECWLSAWPGIGEAFERASAGETAFLVNQRMFLDRNGYLEETFFTFSFSPIRDESGGVGGLFHPVTELTQQTLAERRLKTMCDLADRTAEAQTVSAACDLISQTLVAHDLDLPFALLYLIDADGKLATLAGSAGLAAGSTASPKTVDLASPPQPYRLWAKAARDRQVVEVDDLERLFGPLSCGPYPESPQTAFALPIIVSGLQHPFGLLVAGVSSRRAMDEAYRAFYLTLREAVTNTLANARACEEERKRADALRGSEERFRMLADNAPALIWVTSPTGCEFVNHEYLEFLGVSEEEALGDKWAKFVHPEDREDHVNSLHEAVSSRRRFEGVFRFRRHDGEYRWMRSVGMPRFEGSEFKGYVGSSHDIHEHKLAETALAQMAAIVESSHAAIISKDLNGIIMSWNKGAERLFGYTAEEVIGKSVTILFPPDREDEEMQMLERLRRGERVDHYETVRRRKDGREIDISLTVSPIRDKAGKIIGASKIVRDISERKRIEAEREELLLKESAARAEAEAARAEAEAANHSKDEFLAVVSHELRSPLNSILGYTRILRERSSDESQLKHSCDVIERNARTQLQLIEDLLDTARIGSGKLRLDLRKLDIIPVIVDALNIVRPGAEDKGVRLRIADCGLRIEDSRIADSQSSSGQMETKAQVKGRNRARTATIENQPAIVLGDAARLQQIIWNLLSNAIKFTPAGGSVELRADCAEEHIRIIVGDTGKGIHPEFMPYIFDRFQQRDSSSSRRTGGLGLGLALVKHLTELHGGKVEAMSEGAGRGSTFTVTLPLVAQSEMGAVEVPALLIVDESRTDGGIRLPAGPTIEGVRVLVVDDHEDARDMLAEFLNLCGAVVTTSSSGAEALMVLSNPPGGAPPDIMLCDISMPGEDGYTALRRVRELEEAQGVAASERIPAIALTALTGAKERLRSLSAGFRLHIAKPVDPVELMLVIANTVGISRQEGALH